MSQYPVVAFPTATRKYNRENQRLFTDYGCLESVHTDFHQTESERNTFLTRNLRQILRQSGLSQQSEVKTVDRKILVPAHDFSTFGVSQPLKNIETESIRSNLVKAKKIRHGQSTKAVHAITVTESVNNFILDHPRTVDGGLSRLLGKSAPVDDALKQVRKLCQDFDPSLCGIGRRMLWQFAEDEARANLVEQFCNRRCSGGCLTYRCLDSQKGKELGVLICPQGPGLDDLALKLVSVDFKGLSHGRKVAYTALNVTTGSEIRQKLNGRVQQVEVGSSLSSDNFLFATMSDYNVFLSMFNCHSLKDGEFSNDKVTSSLGLLKSGGCQRMSSIALNPYLAEECAVSAEDGIIRLWNINASINTSGVSLRSLQNLSNKMSLGFKSGDGWSRMCYAAHPRQLYVADIQSTCLFDIRSRKIALSMLDMKKSPHTNKEEKLYSIRSGSSIDNEYQCIIATDYNIFLLDQRHCGEPVIQFGTNMSYPPEYLKIVKVCEGKTASNSAQLRGVHSTYALLVGNQRSSEVLCYQLGKTMKNIFPHISYPCQSIGAPRCLGGNSSRIVVGLEAISIQPKQEECPGMIVFQMTSSGNIGYQTLFLKTGGSGNDIPILDAHRQEDSLMEPSDKRVTYCRQINAFEVAKYPGVCSKGFKKSNYDYDLTPLEIKSNVLPSMECKVCETRDGELATESAIKACEICSIQTTKSAELFNLFTNVRYGLLDDAAAGRPILAKLSLVDVITGIEVYDNEIGSLLKATWNTSYEKYWESRRTAEERRKLQEQVQQNRLSLNLNQRDDVETVHFGGKLLARNSTSIVGSLDGVNPPEVNDNAVSSTTSPRKIILSEPLQSSIKEGNASASPPVTSLALPLGPLTREVPDGKCNTKMNAASHFSPQKKTSSRGRQTRKYGHFPFSKKTVGF